MKKLSVIPALLLALSLSSPASAQPDRSSVVTATAARFGYLLTTNTHESIAQFSQCVIAAMPEQWDFLGKSAGENGYSWANGLRTSHDVIVHHASGRQVDIVSNSAAENGTPGRPTWNPLDPGVYRPSNQPFAPQLAPPGVCTVPATYPTPPVVPPPSVGAHNTRLGVSLFWAMRGMRDYRAALDANLSYIRNTIGADYVRVFMVLGGDLYRAPDGQLYDAWRDASINPTDPELMSWVSRTTDHIYDDYGLKVHWVLVGTRHYVSSAANQDTAVRLWLAAMQGRLQKVEVVEAVNEYTVNGFNASEVRAMGRALRLGLGPDFPITLSSPTSTHNDGSTETQVRSEIEALYGGTDNGGANVFTYHASRPNARWGASAIRLLLPTAARRSSEPRGPGASGGGDLSDAIRLGDDYRASIDAGEAGYVYHTVVGVFGCHAYGFPDQNRYCNLWEVPNGADIARVLHSLRTAGSGSPGGAGGTPNPIPAPGGGTPVPNDPIALLLDLLRRVTLLEAVARAAGLLP